MIVDDSVVVRGIVSKVLAEDSELEVAATAADGRIALNKLAKTDLDIILLDIEMPNMDGFQMLKQLRKVNNRVPVIMFSSLTEHGAAATIDALMLGAKDYVPKPGGAQMSDTKAGKQAIRDELLPKIKQLARRVGAVRPAMEVVPVAPPARVRPPLNRVEIVAIGVSTGGPQALARVLPMFAPNCPVPIVIVQHMPPTFTRHLAERLSSECGVPVDEAASGQSVQPGKVLLAPGGFHMLMTPVGRTVKVRLSEDPPVNACRPSVDVLFDSVSRTYGAASLAVVLTGMGDDGARGCQTIYQSGGRVIVQDEPSSVVWGMPGAVVRAGVADKILPLDAIGCEISRSVWQKRMKDL
jgi:two-component system chemotaxis response regulator CheB